MSITIGQRYTRASDKSQQEANVTVSMDSVRVDKGGQILEVPVIKGTVGQRTYFKEVTSLVRDLLEGSPQGISRNIPYAILTAAPIEALDTYIELYNPTDLDALQLEVGDFLLLLRDFSVDPLTDTTPGAFEYLFCHEITPGTPPAPAQAAVKIPVSGATPGWTDIPVPYYLGSILVNLSKLKFDSTLGDEGQFGMKSRLEQPASPTFTAEGGTTQITVTVDPHDDEAVESFDIWVTQEKIQAVTPDMIPDESIYASQVGVPQVITTYGGGSFAGGGNISVDDYWVTVTANVKNADTTSGILNYFSKYSKTPSDPAEPVLVTTTS